MADDISSGIAEFVALIVVVSAAVAVIIVIGAVALIGVGLLLAGCWIADRIRSTTWWQERQLRQAAEKAAEEIQAAQDETIAAMRSRTDQALAELGEQGNRARDQLATRRDLPK